MTLLITCCSISKTNSDLLTKMWTIIFTPTSNSHKTGSKTIKYKRISCSLIKVYIPTSNSFATSLPLFKTIRKAYFKIYDSCEDNSVSLMMAHTCIHWLRAYETAVHWGNKLCKLKRKLQIQIVRNYGPILWISSSRLHFRALGSLKLKLGSTKMPSIITLTKCDFIWTYEFITILT